MTTEPTTPTDTPAKGMPLRAFLITHGRDPTALNNWTLYNTEVTFATSEAELNLTEDQQANEMKNVSQWLARYYPTLASSVTDASVALDHSLTKWKGLDEPTLTYYGLQVVQRYRLKDVNTSLLLPLNIDSTSCALCTVFLKSDDAIACRGCPLYKVNQRACDAVAPNAQAYSSPWGYWWTLQRPQAMIQLIVDAKQLHKGTTS